MSSWGADLPEKAGYRYLRLSGAVRDASINERLRILVAELVSCVSRETKHPFSP